MTTKKRWIITVLLLASARGPSLLAQQPASEDELDALIKQSSGLKPVQGAQTSKEQARAIAARDRKTADEAQHRFNLLVQRRDAALKVATRFLAGDISEETVNYFLLAIRLGLTLGDRSTEGLRKILNDQLRSRNEVSSPFAGSVRFATLEDAVCVIDLDNQVTGPGRRILLDSVHQERWFVGAFDSQTMQELSVLASRAGLYETRSSKTTQLDSTAVRKVVEEWVTGGSSQALDENAFQRAIGLPENLDWARDAAREYATSVAKLIQYQDGQINITPNGANVEVAVVRAPKGSRFTSTLPSDDSPKRQGLMVFLARNEQGQIRISGISRELLLILGPPPESNYSLMASFRELRLATLLRSQDELRRCLAPALRQVPKATGHGAAEEPKVTEILEENKAYVMLRAFKLGGIEDLLKSGSITSVFRDRSRASLRLTTDRATGVIQMSLVKGGWYLSGAFPATPLARPHSDLPEKALHLEESLK